MLPAKLKIAFSLTVLITFAMVFCRAQDTVPAQPQAPTPEIVVREMELAEAVVSAREKYRLNLVRLKTFYQENGYPENAKVVQTEIDKLEKIPKNTYIITIEGIEAVDPADFQSVAAADQLYKKGMAEKNALDLLKKKQRLQNALKLFKTILLKHPTSDKCDEAAYAIGEIYGGFYFNDQFRALKYFEACYKWNPAFPHRLRWQIANIYDRYLADYDNAVKFFKISTKADPVDYRRLSRERLARLKKMAAEGKIKLSVPID